MKKILWSLTVTCCIILSGCFAGYVATRPPDQRYARSASPGSGYVWISGEWIYSNRKYHWREGSWQKSRPGYHWKPGYWESNRKGYRWHKGQWQ